MSFHDNLKKTLNSIYFGEIIMNTSILETKNICKSFKQATKPLTVLNDISITFKQGETYAITGASGSGKSTLLHILGGLDKPTTGSVLFNSNDISTLRTKQKEQILSSSIGFVFQFHYLINEFTVLENIMLMGIINGKNRNDCSLKAKKLLKQVGLSDKAKQYPWQLSGGEQQRVSILRAIFNKPHFLLADEPTGNLDANNAQQIVELFLTCQKEWNMGVILCSHDKNVYEKMNATFELSDGNLLSLS